MSYIFSIFRKKQNKTKQKSYHIIKRDNTIFLFLFENYSTIKPKKLSYTYIHTKNKQNLITDVTFEVIIGYSNFKLQSDLV